MTEYRSRDEPFIGKTQAVGPSFCPIRGLVRHPRQPPAQIRPMMEETSKRRFLGVVEVDSGTLIIGDPAYFLAQADAAKAGVDYEAVIRADTSVPAQYLDDRPVLLLGQFGGDGTFPVFGEFEEGELVRVTVEFVGPDDTEE